MSAKEKMEEIASELHKLICAPYGTFKLLRDDLGSEEKAGSKTVGEALYRLGSSVIYALQEGSALQALHVMEAFSKLAREETDLDHGSLALLTSGIRELASPYGVTKGRHVKDLLQQSLISAIHDHSNADLLSESLDARTDELFRIFEEVERARPKYDPEVAVRAVQDHVKRSFMRAIELELQNDEGRPWWDADLVPFDLVLSELHAFLKEGNLAGLAKSCLILHSRGEGLAPRGEALNVGDKVRRVLSAPDLSELEKAVADGLAEEGKSLRDAETYREARGRFLYGERAPVAASLVAAAEVRAMALVHQSEASEWLRAEEQHDSDRVDPLREETELNPVRAGDEPSSLRVFYFSDGSTGVRDLDGPMSKAYAPRCYNGEQNERTRNHRKV